MEVSDLPIFALTFLGSSITDSESQNKIETALSSQTIAL